MTEKRGRPKEFRQVHKDAFIRALALTGIQNKALEMMGDNAPSRHTIRRERDSDPEFDAAFREAKKQFSDILEAEAFRRAVQGYEEPVYQNGMLVGYKQKYSDALLQMMMKKFDPEYREKMSVDHEHKGGVMFITPTSSEEEWAKKYELDSGRGAGVLPEPERRDPESNIIDVEPVSGSVPFGVRPLADTPEDADGDRQLESDPSASADEPGESGTGTRAKRGLVQNRSAGVLTLIARRFSSWVDA